MRESDFNSRAGDPRKPYACWWQVSLCRSQLFTCWSEVHRVSGSATCRAAMLTHTPLEERARSEPTKGFFLGGREQHGLTSPSGNHPLEGEPPVDTRPASRTGRG